MDPTSDAELVVNARAGDVDAFTTLVERYRHPALRLAYGIAGDEAEDAVQDAFVNTFRKLDTYRPTSAFRPWLFTIVANEARNRRRSMSRRASLELRVREQVQPTGTANERADGSQPQPNEQRLSDAAAMLNEVTALHGVR